MIQRYIRYGTVNIESNFTADIVYVGMRSDGYWGFLS